MRISGMRTLAFCRSTSELRARRTRASALGTENYWCVNSKASEEDIQATLDFMNWCVTSDEGVEAMCKDMGFVIPFKSKP